MSLTKSIASRLDEVLLSGKWIANTNFKHQLKDVTWQQATFQIDNLNTIALLTYHINYYISGILEAIETNELTIRDQYSFNLPPISSKTAWENLVEQFQSNSEKIIATIEKMEDSILEKPFFDEKYGNYARNFEGLIEHAYYHLGQISLLKKMIIEQSHD